MTTLITAYEVVRNSPVRFDYPTATFNGLDDQKANEFANAISGGELKLAA